MVVGVTLLSIARFALRSTLLFVTLLFALVGAALVAPTRLVSQRFHAHCLAPPRRVVLTVFAFALGVRVTVRSKARIPRGPHLTVANHQTYADIPVLGCVLPGHFISKAEIRSWPLIGLVASLAGTKFVHRQHAKRRHAQIEEIAAVLEHGVPLIGFPEATTSDGSRILPLRTGLFHAAAVANVPIVPVSIEYVHRDGKPLDREERARHAWHGDSAFVPHLLRILRAPGTTAVLRFGPVLLPPHGERREVRDRVTTILEERFPTPGEPARSEPTLSGSS
ncbi:MAG: 1-acyl-sn-glycerol-3-phosphate acyltransferase [Planctomycetes bacterium]|nr:1-acyl-sn-glycerol-3-phosphate acyltransferase [Planctomycetota bacterium]